MKIGYVAMVCALVLAGCAPVEGDKESNTTSSPGVVDSMTQKTTMDAGRKAASTLKAIEAQHQDEFKEAAAE